MTLAAPVDVSLLICRRATRNDLPRLLQLLADDVLGKNREGVGSSDPVYAVAFDTIAGDGNQQLLVAETGGIVVAMLHLTFIPGLSRRGAWRANIESVRVDSAVRSRGIGSWLIEQAVTLAQERGCRLAQLTSDKQRTQAHAFYGRLGFTASHEGFKRVLDTNSNI